MYPDSVGWLWVRVIKEGFGYYIDHPVGDTFRMSVDHVTKCIQDGYIELCVNNLGLNDPCDHVDLNPGPLLAQAVSPFREGD